MHDRLNDFQGKSALVTGASGFIGSRLCQLITSAGGNVEAISRRSSPLPATRSVHCLDLTDAVAVERLVTELKPDFVFHLAGVTSAARTLELVGSTFDVNLHSTVNLLRAVASQSCKRFVLAGSLEEPRVDADGAIVPSSPYAASKHAAACYGRMFHQLFGVPFVTARIFMVYGPGQKDLRKLIPYVTTSLLREKAPKLSSGKRPVDWVYVDDVARDLALAAVTSGLEGKTLDVGTGVLTPVSAVATRLGELMKSSVMPVFGDVADRPAEQVCAADTQARRAMLGDISTTSLDEGLRQTIDWYTNAINNGEISRDDLPV